jgi:hypothetical protein
MTPAGPPSSPVEGSAGGGSIQRPAPHRRRRGLAVIVLLAAGVVFAGSFAYLAVLASWGHGIALVARQMAS